MDRRAFIVTIPLLSAAVIMLRFLFKNRSASERENFRERVLKIVRASYPSVQFEASAEHVDVVIAKGNEIGLQNLKATFEWSDRKQETLEKLVAEHFKFVLQDEPSVPDFAAGRRKLKPQIMPREYAKQAPIISFPFGETLAIGIVLELEKGYLYLKREDALRWKKSEQELFEIAQANLDEASREIQMQASDDKEAKWVGVETKDGFDAARILAPKLREFLASRLGSPFLFAVPNRDFLICWNTAASARFTEFAAAKIRKDFQGQPYPLSPNFFEVTSDGTITELIQLR